MPTATRSERGGRDAVQETATRSTCPMDRIDTTPSGGCRASIEPRHVALSAATLESWQEIVDLIAQVAGVRACLVMRVREDDIEVCVASQDAANPYQVGAREPLLGSGLYCEQVIASGTLLHVADATSSPHWRDNPDHRKHGLIAYVGLPIRLGSGQLFGTLCMLHDRPYPDSGMVTRLMEKLRDLIESHLRLDERLWLLEQLTGDSLLARLLDTLPVAIAASERRPDGRVLYVNAQFTRTFGYALDEMPTLAQWTQDANLDPRQHPVATTPVLAALMPGATPAGTNQSRNLRVRCKDGAWREILINTTVSESLRLIAFIEVSEHTPTAAAPVSAGDEIARAMHELLADTKHVLMTPLHAILGFTEMLERMDEHGDMATAATAERRRELLAIVRRNGQQLLDLVKSILDLGRLEHGCQHPAKQTTDLHRLLRDCAAPLAPLARARGLTFDLLLDANLPAAVQVDRQRLAQILNRLLDDAIRLTPAGKVLLTANASPDPDANDRVALRFTITDTDTADQAPSLEPVRKCGLDAGAPAASGSRLGLPISRRLARVMGGDITLIDTPGRGNQFVLTLPATLASRSRRALDRSEAHESRPVKTPRFTSSA